MATALRSPARAARPRENPEGAAGRTQTDFVAAISHELRSPLTCIIGFAQLLRDGHAGPVADGPREYVDHILESADHLLRLVNDIVDLGRIEAGRMRFRPEPVALGRLVCEVAGVLSAVAQPKGIEVAVSVAPEAAEAELDPGRFKQVLYNYLSNAIKFTPEGGRVEVRIVPEGEAAFRLEVRDTGPGIAPEDLDSLFIEYSQPENGALRRSQGSGLGLAVTKRLVELQGGRVGVTSAPGYGSTFWAVLPRRVV
mgnify:CR=1 FL=1